MSMHEKNVNMLKSQYRT